MRQITEIPKGTSNMPQLVGMFEWENRKKQKIKYIYLQYEK